MHARARTRIARGWHLSDGNGRGDLLHQSGEVIADSLATEVLEASDVNVFSEQRRARRVAKSVIFSLFSTYRDIAA